MDLDFGDFGFVSMLVQLRRAEGGLVTAPLDLCVWKARHDDDDDDDGDDAVGDRVLGFMCLERKHHKVV